MTGRRRACGDACWPVFEQLEARVLLSGDPLGLAHANLLSGTPDESAVVVGLESSNASDAQPSESSTSALEHFGTSPALFVENQGQWADASLRYMHDGAWMDVAVTDSGILFQATRPHTDPEEDSAGPDAIQHGPLALPDADLKMLQFSAGFLGADLVEPVGMEPSEGLFNYYVGDHSEWREGVPGYEIVAYPGLYQGIDLHVQGLRSHMKYEFHVAPGQDYQQIAIRYQGIDGLSLSQDGSLQVNLGGAWGIIRDDAPYIYQEIGGQKIEVAGKFILLDELTYAFEITGDFDSAHVLVIDPDLAWSTYLGGSAWDYGADIAVDASGSLYVTGSTGSVGWTYGGSDPIYGGQGDAFVAKLSASGAHVWSTYLGGSHSDDARGIATDSWGGVYVTGFTQSAGWTHSGFDTTYHGGYDAFLAKLSSNGTHLWSTYLGGGDFDAGYDIAADASGGIYVTGGTRSGGWTSGGFDTTHNGGYDVFVARFNIGGGHLWSTYLGGSEGDNGFGIAVDSSGGVYVTGSSYSAGWANNGFDTTYNGEGDGFMAKLSSGGVHQWSTYVGGSTWDHGKDIALSDSGAIYITGSTGSSGWTSGGFDTTYNGDGDVFVLKLGTSGKQLWSTYVGGSDSDDGLGIAVDAWGGVYVTGNTQSAAWASGAWDTSYNGAVDAFVARLGAGGAHLWSSYLGGSDFDAGQGIAVNSSGDVYITGHTESADWTSGGFDTTHNGNQDAFVVKLTVRRLALDAKGKAQFVDANGDLVVVTLKGDGAGTLFFAEQGNSDLDHIVLTGTSINSSLTIKVGGVGTTVRDIVVYGSLKSLTAKTTDLLGSITIDGTVRTLIMDDVADDHVLSIGASADPKATVALSFDRVADLIVNSLTPIKTLKVTEWLAGSLTAPWLSSLSVKGAVNISGNFNADLTLTGADAAGYSLKTAKIRGQIGADSWDIGGAVNSIKALSTQAGWQFVAQDFVKTLYGIQGLGGVMSALWFGKLSTQGNLSVGLTALGADSKGTALNKLSVSGRIINSSIFALDGSINTFTAGAMQDSACFVGTVNISDSNGDGVEDLPDPAADIALGPGQPELKKLTIKGIKTAAGDFFVNSNIAAARIGSVVIARPQYQNTVVPFGLAADLIKKLAITDGNGKRTFKNLSLIGDSWQQFDFTVHLT